MQVASFLHFILFYSCYFSFFLRLPLFFYTPCSKCSLLCNKKTFTIFNKTTFTIFFLRAIDSLGKWPFSQVKRGKIYHILCYCTIGITSISSCNIYSFPTSQSTIKTIGEGNGNPVQYSCLGNPIDRGDLLATIHGVANGWI